MPGKTHILNTIRKHSFPAVLFPNIEKMAAVSYDNTIEAFIRMTEAVGGKVALLENKQTLNDIILHHYPEAQQIASSLTDIPCVNRNIEQETDPHHLQDIDVCIIKGTFGVAENAAIWIAQTERHRSSYFITQHLVILLKKEALVNNMHEAYEQIDMGAKGFGVFISGPSKTADIEQALVIGAHGPKSVLVILI